MDTRDLLLLKYLLDFKNITKTANALFISQPALTRRLKQLEKELDTQLIESSNKGITLTPGGVETVLYARQALNDIDTLKKRLAVIDQKTAKQIHLTAPNIICEYYFPTIIRLFRQQYPDIRFSIRMAPSSEVVSDTHDEKADFGFLRNDFGWDEEGKILLTTNYIAAVSLHPFTLQDLSHMSRVAYTTDAYYMKMLDLWWDRNFSSPPQIDVQVSSLNLCIEMVLNGIGFGLLPSVLIPDSPEIYKIILNDQSGNPIQRHTYLIYKKAGINTTAKKNFLSFIKEHPFDDFFLLHRT